MKNNKDKTTTNYQKHIIDHSKVLIITTDNDGNIVEFNQEAAQLLGFKKAEVINKPISLVWQNPLQREELLNMVKKYGVARNQEVCLQSKDGKYHFVILTLSQLKNDEGEVLGTVGISKDISEQKMLHHKLLQSEKMAGIGTLASGIAHEINNPLAGILGMAEAIMDEDELETIKSFTKDIIDYTLEASEIVKELTNYSRSAANESVSTLDMSTVIKTSLKIVKHSLNFSGIKVVSDLKNECWISANSGEMQQVFTNLITNSIHAMDEKENDKKLIVSCSTDGHIVKGIISDTGTGISKDHLRQIYDPFFTTKPPGKGTGLGLYVIYNIVEKYKGHIEATSHKGTTFTLTFPLNSKFH